MNYPEGLSQLPHYPLSFVAILAPACYSELMTVIKEKYSFLV